LCKPLKRAPPSLDDFEFSIRLIPTIRWNKSKTLSKTEWTPVVAAIDEGDSITFTVPHATHAKSTTPFDWGKRGSTNFDSLQIMAFNVANGKSAVIYSKGVEDSAMHGGGEFSTHFDYEEVTLCEHFQKTDWDSFPYLRARAYFQFIANDEGHPYGYGTMQLSRIEISGERCCPEGDWGGDYFSSPVLLKLFEGITETARIV